MLHDSMMPYISVHVWVPSGLLHLGVQMAAKLGATGDHTGIPWIRCAF